MIRQSQVWGHASGRDSEAVDTERALAVLERSFSATSPPVGYLSGLTQMRNAIADATGCSLLEAELLVEKLRHDGCLTYGGDTYAPEVVPGSWSIAAKNLGTQLTRPKSGRKMA